MLQHLGRNRVLNDVNISAAFFQLLAQQGQQRLRFEELLNETHVSHLAQLLVVIHCEAKENWSCFLEVLPELAVLGSAQYILKEIGIRRAHQPRSWSALSQAHAMIEGLLETLLQTLVSSFGRGLALH